MIIYLALVTVFTLGICCWCYLDNRAPGMVTLARAGGKAVNKRCEKLTLTIGRKSWDAKAFSSGSHIIAQPKILVGF